MLEKGNYRGLKIPDQILKIAVRIIEKLIKQQLDIDEMQFGRSCAWGCSYRNV